MPLLNLEYFEDLSSYRKKVDALCTERDIEIREKDKEELQLVDIQADIDELRVIYEVLQTAETLMFSNLSVRLGNVITEGLSLVFPEEDLSFVVDFQERRNQTEADLYLMDSEGNKFDPIDEVGGGITDFVSWLLRIAYIKMSNNKDFMFADEPGRFISRDKIGLATQFVSKVCEDLNFEILVVTHIPEMVINAKTRYLVTKRNKVSKVKLIQPSVH